MQPPADRVQLVNKRLPLAAKYYTDSVYFTQDRDAIFYRSWQCVCHLSEVANSGDFTTLAIVDENVDAGPARVGFPRFRPAGRDTMAGADAHAGAGPSRLPLLIPCLTKRLCRGA